LFSERIGKYKMKKIGIFGETFKDAYNLLHKIVYDKKYGEVENFFKQRGTAKLTNGDTYMCIGSKYAACGTRFTDVIIQNGLEDYYVKSVVYPSLVAHEDGTDPTVQYFYGTEIITP